MDNINDNGLLVFGYDKIENMEINEKKLKTILKEQREEYQRYLGALAGGFESQVKSIAESMIGIQEQLISIKEMVVVH